VSLAARLSRVWYDGEPVPFWLAMLEPVYRGLRWLHRLPYKRGWRKAKRVAAPVIVVGNLTAGGSGKTPLAIALVEALRARGMGLVLDIVPNHMAASVDNRWWRDVLACGRESRYADYFDIDWDAGDGRVLLPVLPAPLDEAIRAEEGRVQSSYRSDYQQAVARERELQARVDTLKAQLIGEQRSSIQHNIYQREVDTNRTLYDALLQRYREIGVAGVGLSNIVVVDAAQVPTSPSSPNLLLNMLIALFGGTGLAALTVLALHQIDESIREPGEITRLLNVPLLGAAPDVGQTDIKEAMFDTKSALFESYLAIYANLAFSTDHGVPKSIMVTSSRAAEGKTTTSIAIALILARGGKKVALIDGDMRSPRQHKLFKIEPANQGLSTLLAGRAYEQAVSFTPGIPGLGILPAGPVPPNPVELLSRTTLDRILEQSMSTFDVVIIDTPSLQYGADAMLLARSAGASLAVARTNVTRTNEFRQMVAYMSASGIRVVGSALLDDKPDVPGA